MTELPEDDKNRLYNQVQYEKFVQEFREPVTASVLRGILLSHGIEFDSSESFEQLQLKFSTFLGDNI